VDVVALMPACPDCCAATGDSLVLCRDRDRKRREEKKQTDTGKSKSGVVDDSLLEKSEDPHELMEVLRCCPPPPPPCPPFSLPVLCQPYCDVVSATCSASQFIG
jgi:hypothetical protein